MASDVVRIEINKQLISVLEELRYKVANEIKEKYDLDEVTIPRTMSSQVLAAQHKDGKGISVIIKQTNKNFGVLEIA